MLRSFVYASGALQSRPRTVVPPPRVPPKNHDKGDFFIKVIVYEEAGDQQVKRFTGYSQDSEIIPKTVGVCNKKRFIDNTCTRPVVTTTNSKAFNDCIVIDDLIRKVTAVEWF